MSAKKFCIFTALLTALLSNYGLCKSVLAEPELKPSITPESEQIRKSLNRDAVYYCGSTGNDLLDMDLECLKVVAVYGKGLAIYVDSDFAYGRPKKLIYEMLNKTQVKWKQKTGKVVSVFLVTTDDHKWIATIQPGKPPFMMDEYCQKNAC